MLGAKLRPGAQVAGRRPGPRRAKSSSSKARGARVAPWQRGRQPRRRRGAAVPRSALPSCSRPAATAMTARARPGSAPPARPQAAWDAIGGEPAVAEAGVDLRRRILGHPRPLGGWRATHSGIRRATTTRRHPPPLDRSRRRRRSRAQVEEARRAAHRHRRGARPCRRADRRVLRLRRRPGRQRDRAARPQQRPLDDRGRRDLAVRAAHPRHLRPAAGLDRAHRPPA